ncbi:MAG TPA: arginine deiminase family protein [Crenalkalicoccus sp.]|nr:arginine deiminase family protein [Crenalkalicoccus sp.]
MALPEWRLDSETGVLTDVLLAPPEHFRLLPFNAVARRSIAGGRAADPARARAQHAALVALLEAEGVRCHLVPPAPELPLQVYTRDPGVVTPFGPVVLQPFRPERRGEIAPLIRFLAGNGGALPRFATAGPIEGGDLHVVRPGLVLVGCTGERTTEAAAAQFAGWFEAIGWEARIIRFPEHFLHLDCLFGMVAEGLAVACEEVLGEEVLAFLDDRGIRRVPVGYREVMAMGANLLSLGRERVVSPAGNARINAALRAEGLAVLEPELSEFTPMGGSVHCMTMPLRRV